MHAALNRLALVWLLPPEPAEVIANAIALGWAWAFLHPATFGPPSTTVYFVVVAFGSAPAATWAVATAILPLVSIAWGGRWLRFLSTLACGLTWAVIAVVSMRGGAWLSPAMTTAVACLVALFRSQWAIVHG